MKRVAENIKSETFSEETFFERCNIRNCVFNVKCHFDRCNVITCEGTDICCSRLSNILEQDELPVEDMIEVESTEVIER